MSHLRAATIGIAAVDQWQIEASGIGFRVVPLSVAGAS
jgi:hypothetical protein